MLSSFFFHRPVSRFRLRSPFVFVFGTLLLQLLPEFCFSTGFFVFCILGIGDPDRFDFSGFWQCLKTMCSGRKTCFDVCYPVFNQELRHCPGFFLSIFNLLGWFIFPHTLSFVGLFTSDNLELGVV